MKATELREMTDVELNKQLKDAMGQGLSDDELSNIASGFLGYFIQKHNPEANR